MLLCQEKVHLVKAMVFPAVLYGCERWTIKKAECQRIDAFELWCWRRLLRIPWDCKEIQAVHPKGNQSWIFIGRTDAEVETPTLWPPDVKNWLIWKDPDAGKDWRQEKGMTENEMVGWHHWLSGHEFEQALWMGDGQQGLACCSPWGRKESDTTEWLNWTEEVAGAYLYTPVRYWIFKPWRPELLEIENSGEYSWIQESLFYFFSNCCTEKSFQPA